MAGFVIVATISQAVLLFVHYVLFRFWAEQVSFLARHKVFFGAMLFVLSISFTVSMVLLRVAQNKITASIYTVSAIWLGMILWLFFATVLCVVCLKIIPFWNLWWSVAVLFVAVCINVYGVYHGLDTKVVYQTIPVAHLPAQWEGKRAIFFADTHYGFIHTKNKAEKDARLIASLAPDAIFMAGDFFDGPIDNMDQFVTPYNTVVPPLGKYFVSGNHETYADLLKSITALQKGSFTILDNEGIMQVAGMQIVGVPYTTNTGSDTDTKMTQSRLAGLSQNKPSIVLKHIPIGIASIVDAGSTFAFSGHTHNGQAWPFSLLVKKIYGKHAYGSSKEKDTLFYTTSGVGSWGPPQRIGTQSEVLVVTFVKK
ncbi:MAG: metallophosphoesterase [bacterium]